MKASKMVRIARLTFVFYSMEDRKETVLGEVNAYQISADGKRMWSKLKRTTPSIDLPKDKLETKDHELKPGRTRHAAR